MTPSTGASTLSASGRPVAESQLRVIKALLLALAVVCGLGVAAAPASAAFTVSLPVAEPAGTDANTHASQYTSFSMRYVFNKDASKVRRLRIDLPVGALGTLTNAAFCPLSTFTTGGIDACPQNTRIGAATVTIDARPIGLPLVNDEVVAGHIINLEPQGTEPARIGLTMKSTLSSDPIRAQTPMRLRADYGVTAETAEDLPTEAPCLTGVCTAITIKALELQMFKRIPGTAAAGGGPLKGFFFNPGRCGLATTKITATAYDGSVATAERGYTVTGCEDANFAPQAELTPATSAASAPQETGVDLKLPLDPYADGLPSPIRSATLTLPDGISLSGSTDSDGKLVACTDAQFQIESLGPVACPAGAQTGTLSLTSPLVRTPIPGRTYLALPRAGDDESLVRMLMVAEAGPQADALRVKFEARVRVDETTGRLIAVLDDVPPQPVSRFQLTFRGGDTPTLRQPRVCGTTTGSMSIAPLARPSSPVVVSLPYTVDQNCGLAARFEPVVSMGLAPSTAGVASAATTVIEVPAGHQPLTSMDISLPPGLLADLKNTPRCAIAQLDAGTCGPTSEIGMLTALAGQGATPGAYSGTVHLIDPPTPGALAGFGIRVAVRVGPVDVGQMTIKAALHLRDDYGVDVVAAIPDKLRGIPLDTRSITLAFKNGFVVNPASCTGNSVSGRFTSSEGTVATSSTPLTVTSCDSLAFTPSIKFSAENPRVGAASPFTAEVKLPAATLTTAQAPVKHVVMTLPDGVSVSPSAGADGTLTGCSLRQFGVDDLQASACPASSRVGTVVIDTPSVGRISGSAYLGNPRTHFSDLYVDATSEEFGDAVRVKLSGHIDVHPRTGATTATFPSAPPVPFTRFALTMRGGASPVLTLPPECGAPEGTALLTPHAGVPVAASAVLAVTEGCSLPGRFDATAEIGSADSTAGATTALTTAIRIPGGHQELSSLELTMPPGLLGQLTASAQCAVATARAGGCGDDSLVGHVTAAAGIESAPLTVRGTVHMTEGYDGALAGLMIALPAKVGPIDLGVVRTLTRVDLVGNDLRMRITAPEIPTRIEGVPLQIRALDIAIDRPGVVLNPTRCGTQLADAALSSLQGGGVIVRPGYAATGCEALDWQPSAVFDFSGAAAEIKKHGHPTLTTLIGQRPGRGNLSSISVELPDGVATDLKNVNARTCESAAYAAAGLCPPHSTIGAAVINTPALPQPVAGEIVVVRVPGATLPGIAVRIRDRIRFDVVGAISLTKSGQIRASFAGLPDAPIAEMRLTFDGGPKGILQLGQDLCDGTPRSTNATLVSHHGASRALATRTLCNGGDPLDSSAGASRNVTGTAKLDASGSGSVLLRNPNGIRRIVMRMPKGAIFNTKRIKRIKVKLGGGVQGRVVIRGGKRNVRISIVPRVAGAKVSSARVTLRTSSIRVNVKTKRSLKRKKLTLKQRSARLRKVMTPTIVMTDNLGKQTTVKTKSSLTGVR